MPSRFTVSHPLVLLAALELLLRHGTRAFRRRSYRVPLLIAAMQKKSQEETNVDSEKERRKK